MKKYSIIFTVLLCVSNIAFSQFITSLTVNQPSATLSEWYNNTTIIYVVENIGPMARPFIIKAELKTTDGTSVATKDLSKAQVFTLQGIRAFFAKDVFPLEIMIFNGSFNSTLIKTGKLASGTYQLEVQLVDPATLAPLTAIQTRVFNLTAPQLPYLITPVNNDTLNAKLSENAIIFRWTSVIPRTQEQPYYRLQVFEILPYQQPLQALRGNQPLLDKILRVQTQFIWRPQMPLSIDSTSRKFIWTIQTLNSRQQPFIQTSGNGESRSEPFLFSVRAKHK